jgi:threonine-phosphate decarboxylase
VRVRHGGELRQFSEKFGIPERDIIDFSSNINPFGPPLSVKEAYPSGLAELQHYPDPEALEFRREVARRFPLWPENVVAGNGAIELLDLILRFLRPKRALLVEPTFLEYRRLLNLQGAEIRNVSLKEKDGFRFAPAELMNALQRVEVVILGHPNNPTGTALPKDELQHFLREAKRRNIFVILDEAFVDWSPELSLAGEVRDDSFFFVIRSLTKFFALPGIRIGYGLGSRKLIEKLASYQIPWSCNRLAQKLGRVALQDQAYADESRQWLVRERGEFGSHLAEISWLKVYPSVTNFLLIRCAAPFEGPFPLTEKVARQGFPVRDLSEYPSLGHYYFRVAVRKREENMKLIEAITGRGEPVCSPQSAPTVKVV